MSGRPQLPEHLTGRPTLHGAYQRPTRSRRVRKARRRFVGWLTDGYPEPSTREQLLVSTTADLMVRLSEANAYIDSKGLLTGDGEPQPVMRVYIAMANAVRRNLEVLGLRPDLADRVPSLAEYLAQRPSAHETAPAPASATITAAADADADEAAPCINVPDVAGATEAAQEPAGDANADRDVSAHVADAEGSGGPETHR